MRADGRAWPGGCVRAQNADGRGALSGEQSRAGAGLQGTRHRAFHPAAVQQPHGQPCGHHRGVPGGRRGGQGLSLIHISGNGDAGAVSCPHHRRKGGRCTLVRSTAAPVCSSLPGLLSASQTGAPVRGPFPLLRKHGLFAGTDVYKRQVLESQFAHYFEMAERKSGITGENLLRILESRLDNIVYRAGFAMSQMCIRDSPHRTEIHRDRRSRYLGHPPRFQARPAYLHQL